MPAATKRRKLSTARNAASQALGINAFAKVSKASSTPKSILEKNDVIESFAPTSLAPLSTKERKRKLEQSHAQLSEEAVAVVEREIKALPARCPTTCAQIPQTPKKSLLAHAPSSIDTPTKGARSLLDRFYISKTPTKTPLRDATNNSAATPEKIAVDLPIEIIDLINLHAAFLTALSVHYAHNGTHSPADLRNLCPDVARAWGKRSVVLIDVRRCLGVLNASIPEGSSNHRISQLSLSDYGHGKICVEMALEKGSMRRIARPVSEDVLNGIFEQGLKGLWENRDADMTAKDVIESMPMEPITMCDSLVKMSPLLAKGQRRLEDMKAGIMAKKTAKNTPESTPTKSDGTKLTLLERLRAKQLHQSTLSPAPSKECVARKVALGRIEDVVAVLAILSTSSSTGQQRISFTMPTIIGKLRDSFKTPMSKEEAGTCVRLLASDIAPAWVKIIKLGKSEALIVDREARPEELDIKERVKRAYRTGY